MSVRIGSAAGAKESTGHQAESAVGVGGPSRMELAWTDYTAIGYAQIAEPTTSQERRNAISAANRNQYESAQSATDGPVLEVL